MESAAVAAAAIPCRNKLPCIHVANDVCADPTLYIPWVESVCTKKTWRITYWLPGNIA